MRKSRKRKTPQKGRLVQVDVGQFEKRFIAGKPGDKIRKRPCCSGTLGGVVSKAFIQMGKNKHATEIC